MTRSLAALLLLAALVPRAQSQEDEALTCPAVGRPLTVARLTWHEAGVDALVDAAAIYASLRTLSRIRGETWEETACAYSGRALRGETARPWIAALDASGLAPAGWPAASSWDRQGPLFARLLAHAGRVDAGETDPVCDREPTDWGDPELDAHRIERGIARGYWSRVTCDGARGLYLRRAAADRVDDTGAAE